MRPPPPRSALFPYTALLRSGSLTGTAITVNGGVLSESSTGIIGGASTFTHSSTGTSVLAGANTYTGATSVSAGTLSLTESLTAKPHPPNHPHSPLPLTSNNI